MPADPVPGLFDALPDWFAMVMIVAASLLVLGPLVPLVAVLPLLAACAPGAARRGDDAVWPAVSGSVLSVEVVARAPPEGGAAVTYHPRIVCGYAVRGQDYRGDRLGTSPTDFDAPAPAQAMAGRYRPGDAVRVFYDPADPGRAVLENMAPALVAIRPGWFVGIGIAMMAAGLLALVAIPLWLLSNGLLAR